MKKKIIVKSQERVSVSTKIAVFRDFFFFMATALKHSAALKKEFAHRTYNIAMQGLDMKGKAFNFFPLWTLHKQRS